ncbi:hypothetical protein DFH06DRAFT_1397109 [Mycena polygramma]|nr:hypothetical protein DFH06DRAFT_1397109 [Mycena polygramma]
MRYLRIQLVGSVPPVVYTNSRVAAAIPLTSLYIAISPEPPRRFFPTLWAFGASQLKALWIHGIVDWVLVAPARDTIEILGLNLQPGHTTGLDLSAFPSLSVLYINCIREYEADLRALISTILPAHRIRTVAIEVWPRDREICRIFDETLEPLQISLVEVYSTDEAHAPDAAEYFPRLRARGVAVRYLDFHGEWWGENMVRDL